MSRIVSQKMYGDVKSLYVGFYLLLVYDSRDVDKTDERKPYALEHVPYEYTHKRCEKKPSKEGHISWNLS